MFVGLAALVLLVYHVVTFPIFRSRSLPLEPTYRYRLFAIIFLWLASAILARISIATQRTKLGYIAVAIAGFPLVICILVVAGSLIL